MANKYADTGEEIQVDNRSCAYETGPHRCQLAGGISFGGQNAPYYCSWHYRVLQGEENTREAFDEFHSAHIKEVKNRIAIYRERFKDHPDYMRQQIHDLKRSSDMNLDSNTLWRKMHGGYSPALDLHKKTAVETMVDAAYQHLEVI